MLDQHMQIGLGLVKPDDEAWSRNWFGWDPAATQQELWDHNCEVWRIRQPELHKFWVCTNRLLTLVPMETKKIAVVAQVTALLHVTDVDTDQVAERYLDRWAFRGRVLVDHEWVGRDWEFIQHGARQWPVQMVPGAVPLAGSLALA